MDLHQITDIYRQMGIGTQRERDELLKWSFETPSHTRSTTFYIEAPNSDQTQPQSEEPKIAQLA